MSQDADKSEQPTEKRLREAHEQGQFARAPEIGVVFVLAGAFAVLLFTIKAQTARMAGIAVSVFSQLGRHSIEPEAIAEWSSRSAATCLQLILPLGATCAGASILAGGLQSRFQFTPKVLELKFSRLNPVSGFKQLYGSQGWIKVLSESVKIIIVGAILALAIADIMRDPLFSVPVSMPRLGMFLYDSVALLLSRFAIVFGLIAAANYVYQSRKVQRDLMMTRQEVKEEFRSSEGDPHVRAARRAMARRLLQRQMLGAVPSADVVVTNPTHYAIALRYERGQDQAPVVLAKGANLFAQRIKALAAENEVPTVENRAVARMLYKYGKVGKPIPASMFRAVAEILAFVYKTHRYYFHKLRQRRSRDEAASTQNGGAF